MTTAPTRATDPSPGARPPRRGPVAWAFIAVGIIVAMALVIGSFTVWQVLDSANDVQRTESLLPASDDSERPPADATAAGSINVVLLGSDSRGEDQGRSDVLMLAHVPPGRERLYIISFPRDMWVQIPGRGYAKINAAYAYGGEQLASRTLESLVGVRMDHAAKIDFEGFMGLTTALDGVTVDNQVASTSGEYRWPKGPVTIQGEEALAFVRQRHELPNGDLDRAARQRAVVKAILVRLLSLDVLANPALVANVAGQLSQYVVVDEGLSTEVILRTASSMKLGGGEQDVVLLQAPISGFGTSPDGQSIDLVDEEQLAEMATAIQTGEMAAYYERYGNQPLVPGR